MKKAILIIGCFLVISGGPVFAKEVLINPITPDIRDRLRESTDLVTNVEDTMAPMVTDLEKIYKTYTETCKDNGKDRGCVEMQTQVREKYKDVLSIMEKDLPKVKQSVSQTAQNLGLSINAKTRNKTLKDLFDGIAEKGTLPKVRGPLSKKLSELLKALGRPSTNVSVLELSLQTQADLISANEILEYLEAEINRQIVVVDMMQDFGVLSPEMATVMKGVAEIFGYDVDFGELDEGPPITHDDWRS